MNNPNCRKLREEGQIVNDILANFLYLLSRTKLGVPMNNCLSGSLLNKEIERRNINPYKLPTQTRQTLKQYNKMLSLICELFKLIEADPYSKELFENIYVYPNRNNLPQNTEVYSEDNPKNVIGEGPAVYPNLSELHIGRLIEELCDRAEAIRDDPRSSFAIGRHLLLGGPGSGKTFFINYFTSVYADYMRGRNVIWVRSDLTKSIFEQLPILERLHHQVLKILFKWYKKTYDITTANKELIDFLCERTTSQSGYISSESHAKLVCENLKTTINHDYKNHSFEKEKWYLYQYAEFIMEYLRVKKGCAFILMLDGLDLINFDDESYEAYYNWVRDAVKLVGQEKQNYGLYIFSMRDTSLHFIERYLNRGGLGDFKRWWLLNVPLRNIIEARLAVLSRRYKENYVQGDDSYFYTDEQLGDISEIWITMIDDIFRRWAKEDSNGVLQREMGKADGFEMLEAITNYNNRAAITFVRQIIELLYTDDPFIREIDKCLVNISNVHGFAGAQFYHFVKPLFCGEHTFYVNKIHNYALDGGFNRFEDASAGVIPNLYTYIKPLKRKAIMTNNSLLRLRILQFIDFFFDRYGPILRSDIERFLLAYFVYRTDIQGEIDEMTALGLVQPYSETHSIHEDIKCGITRLGRLLINYFIYDYSYYEHVFHASEVPVRILDVLPYSYIESMGQLDDRMIAEMFTDRMECVYLFVKYLKICEENEAQILAQKKKEIEMEGKTILNTDTVYDHSLNIDEFIKQYMSVFQSVEKCVLDTIYRRMRTTTLHENQGFLFRELKRKYYH